MSATRREIAGDLSLLTGVVALLLAAHLLLPPATRATLSFDARSFAPLTLLTGAYLHVNDAHLVGNVVGFCSAGLVSYLVCLQLDERGWFHRTAACCLLCLPVVVNLGSYAAFSFRYPGLPLTTRGFSGVVAGFAGFLLVGTVALIRRRHSRETTLYAGSLIVLCLLGAVLVTYTGVPSAVGTGLFVLGAGVPTLGLYGEARRAGLPTDHTARVRVGVEIGTVLLLFGVLLSLVLGLFPADLTAGGWLTNVVGHGVGFLAGVVVAVAAR
jgi:hypothetical protein